MAKRPIDPDTAQAMIEFVEAHTRQFEEELGLTDEDGNGGSEGPVREPRAPSDPPPALSAEADPQEASVE